MSLSSDLISQFVKATKDESPKNSEATVQGTTVEYNGSIYVKLDGSDQLTPVTSTADTKAGERVTVLIKDHSATVTGNMSSPSARTDDVKEIGNQITQVEILVADKVSTSELEAEKARIEELRAENVTIKGQLTANNADISNLKAQDATITGKLTAAEADISNLQTTKLDAEIADVKYATVGNLEATNANVHNLEATYGEFAELTAEKIEAAEADISKLETDKLSAGQADIKYATIAELNAAKAHISSLDAEVADIDTLIFGSASGTSIQTSFANAVIAQLGNAQIKSAMIKDISVDKIIAGDISTNNFRVVSDDGKLIISDETIQISDDNRVRVQIGKDALNDYSVNVWDADGNLMFSKGGITDAAIKEAIIRDDMVTDDANISASKLNISSLFEEINGAAETIKSTKILLDEENQTLDVAFEAMTTEVVGVKGQLSSQGTQISAIQGQISSKIWEQDIEATIDNLEIGGRNYALKTGTPKNFQGSNSENQTTYVYNTSVNWTELIGKKVTLSFDYEFSDDAVRTDSETKNAASIGMRDSPWSRWVTIPNPAIARSGKRSGTVTIPSTTVSSISIGIRLDYFSGTLTISNLKFELGNKATDWTPAPEDVEESVSTLSTKYSSIEQTVGGISTTVARHESDISGVTTRVTNAETHIDQNAENIGLLTSRTNALEGTTETLQSSINLMPGGIMSQVSASYATKADLSTTNSNVSKAQSDIDNLDVGGRNYIRNGKGDVKAGFFENFNTVEDGYGEHALTSKKTYSNVQIGSGFILGCRDYEVGRKVTMSYDIMYTAWDFPEGTSRGEFWIGQRYGGVPSGETGTGAWTMVTQHNLPEVGVDGCELNEWVHVERTFTIPTPASDNIGTATAIQFYNPNADVAASVTFRIKNVKLEYGNKATDWSPAPEDIDSAVDKAKQDSVKHTDDQVKEISTQIKQLKNSLQWLIRGEDGNSAMYFDEEKQVYTFSAQPMLEAIGKLGIDMKDAIDLITGDGGVDERLSALRNELDGMVEYVKTGRYNGQPCIELGELDTGFKLRITNTELQFVDGTVIPAYISNKKLMIEIAEVKKELQFDGFVWKKRVNSVTGLHHLGLLWKGVSS